MGKQANKKPSVTVLIAALNEEKNIRKVVLECLLQNKIKSEVLVVLDSKTTDKTKEVAKRAGARVVHIGKGIGKGTAIRKSIPYIKTEYVVQIDADYQFLPSEIPKLISKLLDGYDVVLGTRYQDGSKVEKGSVSFLRLFGSWGLSFATTIFARQRITDVMAGFKAFKTPVLKDLNPKVDHFGYEAELVIRAAKKGYKITSVPISYKNRMNGRSNVSSVKHGFLVLGTIIKTAAEKI